MNLNWILIVWPAAASAILVLAVIHLLIWLNNRTAWANLCFFMTTAATAALAICELWMMRAETPAEFGTAVRWLHVPAFVIVVSLTAFVLLHLRAGRRWLAWTIYATRTFALLLNFLVGQNLNYLEISRLQHIPFLGESVSIAEGVRNPLMLLGQLSLLLFVVFVTDAAITVWRRGDRRRALITGGSVVFFVLTATVQAVLVLWGIIQWPITASMFFMGIVLAMSYEMSRDVLRAAQLATQLEKSESSLRKSEQRFDQATEAAEIGTWEWDVVRDEIWATNRGRAIFGFDPAQRIDFNSVVGVVHPEDRDAMRESVMHSLETGGSYEREYRVVLPGGEVRWIITRGGVEADANGQPALMRGVSIDITVRKNAEERFQRVVEAAPFGIIILNNDGRIELVNAKAEADFAYSRQELVGQLIEVLVPESVSAKHAGHRRGFFIAPSARRMTVREIVGRRKDGSEIPVEIGLDPIHLPAGLGVIATIVDVSERKQHDDLLRKERAFLRQVIDIAPNLIFTKNRNGQFTLVNQAVADIYGTTVDDLIGKTDADFDDNVEEVDAFRRADLEVMDTMQERFILEERITDAAGKLHWLQTVKRPILSEDGTSNQILGSATDITARKQADHEIEKKRNELAHLSRVTMLSELSGSLAHELNQPLAAILSNAQAASRFLAEDKPNLDEVREILHDIAADDKRAGEIIQGLRLLLKKGERRKEICDMNDVVRDVLRLVNSDLLNAGVQLTTQFTPGLPQLVGDRVQLQQIMLNLVLNGCDAMHDNVTSERKILVSTELGNDEYVRICVTDQGPGIQDQDLERVFEPFFTTKVHGLGLGLSVCRQIAIAHSGRLWVTNNAARGATFHLTLPMNLRSVA